VHLAPPEWLAPWCRFDVAAAGMTIRDDLAKGMFVDALDDLAE